MQSYVADGKISGTVTGQMVRHGAHPLCLAACLQAGGPKGSAVAGEHDFTIPGVYACLDGQLAPFDYATRARVAMHHAEAFRDNATPHLPLTHSIFRGEETAEGAGARTIRSFGCDQQYIYPEDHHVLWNGLQVWIGYPMKDKCEIGIFSIAPCFDGSRRCARVLSATSRSRKDLSWSNFPKTLEGTYPEDSPLAPPIINEVQWHKATMCGKEDALFEQPDV